MRTTKVKGRSSGQEVARLLSVTPAADDRVQLGISTPDGRSGMSIEVTGTTFRTRLADRTSRTPVLSNLATAESVLIVSDRDGRNAPLLPAEVYLCVKPTTSEGWDIIVRTEKLLAAMTVRGSAGAES